MQQLHYQYSRREMGLLMEQSVYRIGSYHYNWHRELELLVVLWGEIEVCSQVGTKILSEDDVIFINPNSGHATFSRRPESVAMVLHIDPIFFQSYFEDAEHLLFHISSDERTRDQETFRLIRRYLAQMMVSAAAEPQKRLTLESSVFGLMDHLTSAFAPERVKAAVVQMNRKKQTAVEEMLKYINKNYKKKNSLDALARAVGYHPSYASSLFKQCLGINFYDYLTRVRLREATRRLSQSDEKILEIALEHGFPDLKAFNAAFRENFHKSPTEYRRSLSEDHVQSDMIFKREYVSWENLDVQKKVTCSLHLPKNHSLDDFSVEVGASRSTTLTRRVSTSYPRESHGSFLWIMRKQVAFLLF